MTSPVWPKGQSIPVLGTTGEFKSGKTLFLLTICTEPGATLLYDLEKSAETYESLGLGFVRTDVYSELIKVYPNGHKPIQLFEWWWKDVRQIEPGKYRVIALDPVSEIESGLCEWVRKHPDHFNHTAAQYQKMEGLFWGDVKDLWKAILADLSSRCETFAFASHLRDEWKKGAGGGPTGKRVPKGKETLMELSSLYLMMDRRPVAGKEPTKPAANVMKSRLVNASMKNGDIELVPTLPARLPIATPHAIRQYMLNPAGAREATAEELAPEEKMSEDDRLRLQVAKAQAEAEAEASRLERANQQAAPRATQPRVERTPKASANGAAKHQADAASEPPASDPEATGSGSGVAIAPPPIADPATLPAPAPNGKANDLQLSKIKRLRDDLYKQMGISRDDDAKTAHWKKILDKRGVASARDLTEEQAEQLLTNLISIVKEPSNPF